LGADIRLGVGKTIREQREFRSDIARLRQELATLCGLPHPERISVIGKPTRRLVSLESLDVDYLISMAQLHRSDLLDLKARLALAKAELMGAKAAKIPFFTFVDGGWATSQTSVRAGISLPLFDWFGINKAHLEHETASTAYSQQIEEQSRLIATDIRQAIDRIRAAAKELSVYESDLARVKADSRKSIEQTSVDPIRSLKTRYQTEELVFKFEEDRYEVWSDYYKAVMELERALGTRLERVLSR
jgi:outer membrane protein TolC